MPGAGSSNRSTPRASICGCACRRAGTRSKCRRARARAEKLARGTVYANLTVERKAWRRPCSVNEPVLDAVLATLKSLRGKVEAAPPTLDGILALKGVIEVTEDDESEEERRAAEAAIVAGFDAGARRSRRHAPRARAQTLGRLLSARLAEIAALAARAEAAPGRKPEAIKARLAEQVATLLAASQRFDADRLHQEAILLASQGRHPRGARPARRACRAGAEAASPTAGRSAAGSIFWRRSSTANRIRCAAKANDVELTNIGLELKSVVEQFREQVQNLE